MFKLLITLNNYRNGDVRQMVYAKTYPTYDEALSAAGRMEYTRTNGLGQLLYKCTVQIIDCGE
ncbi:hypothetical protein YW90_001521 [Salmonella enterica subsp. enterica]|nr:hypothetical protein [Salmonella enterica subsp. enterica]